MKRYLIFGLLIKLLISCKKDDSLIVAETVISDYDTTFISMRITSDSNWIFIIDRELTARHDSTTGKVKIKGDTLYFANAKRFDKAVIRNNYLEFVSKNFRLPVKKNFSGVHSIKHPVISSDFIFFSNDQTDLHYNESRQIILKTSSIAYSAQMLST